MAANNYGDKDIATNLLVTLKHMKSEFNLFTQEASNTELFEEADKMYNVISTLQRDVYDMMSAQGWYKMTSDTASSISKAYTKAKNSESDLA